MFEMIKPPTCDLPPPTRPAHAGIPSCVVPIGQQFLGATTAGEPGVALDKAPQIGLVAGTQMPQIRRQLGALLGLAHERFEIDHRLIAVLCEISF